MNKIEKIIKNHNLFQIYQSSYICIVAKKIIKNLTNIKTEKINYKNNTLKIELLDPFLVTQLRNKNEIIIEKINKKLGRNKIKRISIT